LIRIETSSAFAACGPSNNAKAVINSFIFFS
jgi:hypothetical protein